MSIDKKIDFIKKRAQKMTKAYFIFLYGSRDLN